MCRFCWFLLFSFFVNTTFESFVVVRCRQQNLVDLSIRNMIAFIDRWNSSAAHTQVNMNALITYIKFSLGYTGSTWEGAIGDMPLVDACIDSSNSSSPGESHFAAYWLAVANSKNENKPDHTVLHTFLGVNPDGSNTNQSTYWSTMNQLDKEKPQTLNPTDVRRREFRGTWLVILQRNKSDEEPNYIQLAESPMAEDGVELTGGPFYHVKSGVKDILNVSKHEESKLQKEQAHLSTSAQSLLGGFDIQGAAKILIPENIPIISGYFTVDVSNGICYLCSDYIKRGCLRSMCKHAIAANLFASNDGVIKDAESSFCMFLHNREKSNIPRCRNMILYNGIPGEVIDHLKAGGVSSCGYRGKSQYDIDSTTLTDRPDLFIHVNIQDLYAHCTLKQVETCSQYLFVASYSQSSSQEFFKNLGLMYQDSSRADGFVQPHNILTYPQGDECYPMTRSPKRTNLSIIRVLQPQEARRERAPAYELAKSRVPGGGRIAKRKDRTVVDSSFPNDIRAQNGAHETQHKNKRPSQIPMNKSFNAYHEMEVMAVATKTALNDEYSEIVAMFETEMDETTIPRHKEKTQPQPEIVMGSGGMQTQS